MRNATAPEAGVIIHTVDSREAEGREWAPAADRAWMSSSILSSVLRRTYATIPLFSYDSGVILDPAHAVVTCAYGMDASTLVAHKETGCQAVEEGKRGQWQRCEPDAVGDCSLRTRANTCGFHYVHGWSTGATAWRPEDVYRMLECQSHLGRDAELEKWHGYNELVVAAEPWRTHLPHSIEAVALIDCVRGEPNHYFGNPKRPGGVPTAHTCDEAHEVGRRLHRAFMAAYGLSEDELPLVLLRRDHWEEPFVLAPPNRTDFI